MARKAYRRILHVFESLAAETVRRRMGRRVVAERVRRARRKLYAANHFFGRNVACRSAPHGEFPGSRAPPAHPHFPWHGRTKKTPYPKDPERRGKLGAGAF